MGLDVKELLCYVVRPALKSLGGSMASESAERLVLYTAAVESKFRNIQQIGGGPAVGLWQVEPFTFRDLRDRVVPKRPQWAAAVAATASGASLGKPEPEECRWNLRLAAMFCRIKYATDKHPLPDAHDLP